MTPISTGSSRRLTGKRSPRSGSKSSSSGKAIAKKRKPTASKRLVGKSSACSAPTISCWDTRSFRRWLRQRKTVASLARTRSTMRGWRKTRRSPGTSPSSGRTTRSAGGSAKRTGKIIYTDFGIPRSKAWAKLLPGHMRSYGSLFKSHPLAITDSSLKPQPSNLSPQTRPYTFRWTSATICAEQDSTPTRSRRTSFGIELEIPGKSI